MEEEEDVGGSTHHHKRRKILSNSLTTINKHHPSQSHSTTSLIPKPNLDVFPDELLLEIIVRLPVNSIFKFKCVSKHWQSLISHPSLCRSFLSRRRRNDAGVSFRILHRYIYVSKLADVVNRFHQDIYNSPNYSVVFLSTFEEQQELDQFKVMGSSNGLVLVCSTAPLRYYVCDPVSKKLLSLPSGNIDSNDPYPMIVGECLVSQVDQENVVTSFKVVRVRWMTSESNKLNLDIYSSERGVWNHPSLLCSHPIQLLKRGCGPIHFNGYIHLFVHGGMVAFNPYKDTKRCRLIKFPDYRDVESDYAHDGLYRLCDECQGELRFFEVSTKYSDFYLFSMWVLNDHEKGEWVLKFKVTRSDIWSYDLKLSNHLMSATFVPLSFHPFDSDVVYLRCVEPSCIVLYNILNQRVDVLPTPIGVVEQLSWRVVMPFVLPMWPTPVPLASKKAVFAERQVVTRSALKFRRHG